MIVESENKTKKSLRSYNIPKTNRMNNNSPPAPFTIFLIFLFFNKKSTDEQ